MESVILCAKTWNLYPLMACSCSQKGNGWHQPAAVTGKMLCQNQPKSLCRLCGNVALPADGGNALTQYLRDNESNLVGVNDV